MKSSFEDDEIETRLREEAGRLFQASAHEPPRGGLLAEHRRRARRRKAGWAACGVAAILAGVWSGGVIRGLLPAKPVADREAEVTAEATPPSRQQENRPRIASGKQPPESVNRALALPADGPIAIPVFFTEREGDRYKVIGAGLYLPPRKRELPLSELPPAARYAAGEVLGIDANLDLREPI